jgi:glycogen synthase
LFDEESVNISGSLDYFYRGVLIFVPFSRYSTEEEIKTCALAVLKCFEQRKIIQVIFNTPKDFENNYFKNLMEYLNNEKVLRGKWLSVEGNINLMQFTSSSDIVLLPYGRTIGVENILYTSLRNGCVPVVLQSGTCGDIVADIYDDMNIGCGFKGTLKQFDGDEQLSDSDLYTNTLLKALSFHLLNPSGWNRLVNNALEFDNSWNFELIEKYNNIYNNIV